VVVLAGAEIKPDAAIDLGMMIALLNEAVAQRDTLGGTRRRRQHRKGCHGDDRDGKERSHSQFLKRCLKDSSVSLRMIRSIEFCGSSLCQSGFKRYCHAVLVA